MSKEKPAPVSRVPREKKTNGNKSVEKRKLEEMDNRCEKETMSEGLLLIVMALLLIKRINTEGEKEYEFNERKGGWRCYETTNERTGT